MDVSSAAEAEGAALKFISRVADNILQVSCHLGFCTSLTALIRNPTTYHHCRTRSSSASSAPWSRPTLMPMPNIALRPLRPAERLSMGRWSTQSRQPSSQSPASVSSSRVTALFTCPPGRRSKWRRSTRTIGPISITLFGSRTVRTARQPPSNSFWPPRSSREEPRWLREAKKRQR